MRLSLHPPNTPCNARQADAGSARRRQPRARLPALEIRFPTVWLMPADAFQPCSWLRALEGRLNTPLQHCGIREATRIAVNDQFNGYAEHAARSLALSIRKPVNFHVRSAGSERGSQRPWPHEDRLRRGPCPSTNRPSAEEPID